MKKDGLFVWNIAKTQVALVLAVLLFMFNLVLSSKPTKMSYTLPQLIAKVKLSAGCARKVSHIRVISNWDTKKDKFYFRSGAPWMSTLITRGLFQSCFYNRCCSTIKKWKNITMCIWSNCSVIIALVQKSIIVKSAIWTQPWGSRSMEEVDLVEKIQTVTVCFNKYRLSTLCLIFYGHSHITPKPPSPI